MSDDMTKPTDDEVRRALLMALAYIRWLTYDDCRTPGWEGAPPSAREATDALEAVLEAAARPSAAEPVAWLAEPTELAHPDMGRDVTFTRPWPRPELKLTPLYAYDCTEYSEGEKVGYRKGYDQGYEDGSKGEPHYFPVAWRYRTTDVHPWQLIDYEPSGNLFEVEPLYAAPPAQPSQSTVAALDNKAEELGLYFCDKCGSNDTEVHLHCHSCAAPAAHQPDDTPINRIRSVLLAVLDGDALNPGDVQGMLDDLALLAAPAAQPPQAWVSVKDRLPERGVDVLVATWKGDIAIDRWDEIFERPVNFSSATICVGDGWQEYDDFYDVTHWMPLPSAPIAEASDEPCEDCGALKGKHHSQCPVIWDGVNSDD